MTSTVRAAVGAALLAVPVAVEAFWLHAGDRLSGHLFFAASQLVGWALLLTVALELKRRQRDGRALLPRLVVAGAAVQMGFAAAYGVTAVVAGEPADATFGLFALGFLLLVVGGIGWGLRLRRSGSRLAGGGLVATGALGLLAIVVGTDPWHDIFLLSSYVAWVVVGASSDVLDETASAAVPAAEHPMEPA